MADKDLTKNNLVYPTSYMVMAQRYGPSEGFTMYGPFSTKGRARRWAQGEFPVDIKVYVEPFFHTTLHGEPRQ